jgi:plasmid maintenance system antidote protein VapI
MELDITKNFNHIFAAVSNKGIKRTAFAKAMGYSSTSQLAATLEGEALISTKAIIELIKNFNVNPTFLFTGQGEVFLTDESEIENLRKENRVLTQNHDAWKRDMLI